MRPLWHNLGTRRGDMVARWLIHLRLRRAMTTRGDVSRFRRWTTFGYTKALPSRLHGRPRWTVCNGVSSCETRKQILPTGETCSASNSEM